MILATTFACFWGASWSWAASMVTMETTLGYGGHFQLGTWVPLTLQLDNRGNPIEGQLLITVGSGSELQENVFHTSYSSPLELPRQSKKLYSFTIFIQTFSHPLTIQLLQGDTVLLEKKLNLRDYFTDKKMVLFLGNEVGIDLFSKEQSRLLPLVTQVPYLPESRLGYQGVAMVVLHAKHFQRMRALQYEGLTEWLNNGGKVVVLGDINYRALLETRVQNLLPVRISGVSEMEALPTLQKFSGTALNPSETFLVLQSEVPEAEVLLQEGSHGLIFQRSVGLGQLKYLAFNPQKRPFTQWAGRHAFWETLVGELPSSEDAIADGIPQKILSNLANQLPSFFISAPWASGFMAVYLLLLFVVTRLLKKKDHLRVFLKSAAVGTAVLFSGASYQFIYLPTLEKIHTKSISFIRYQGDDLIAQRSSFVGAFSLHQAPFTLSFINKSQAVHPVELAGWKLKNPPLLEFEETVNGRQVTVQHQRWSHRFLRLDSSMDLPLYSQARIESDSEKVELVLEVENRSPFSMVDGQIYFLKHLIPLGELEADSKVTKRFEIQKDPEYQSQLEHQVRDDLFQYLIGRLHEYFNESPEALYVVGRMRGTSETYEHTGQKDGNLVFIEWKIPVAGQSKIFANEVL